MCVCPPIVTALTPGPATRRTANRAANAAPRPSKMPACVVVVIDVFEVVKG